MNGIKYQYVRIKDEYPEDNVIVLVANCQKVLVNSSNQVRNIRSLFSDSVEFEMGKVPTDLDTVPEREVIDITPEEFDDIQNLYKTNKKGFLQYRRAIKGV